MFEFAGNFCLKKNSKKVILTTTKIGCIYIFDIHDDNSQCINKSYNT